MRLLSELQRLLTVYDGFLVIIQNLIDPCQIQKRSHRLIYLIFLQKTTQCLVKVIQRFLKISLKKQAFAGAQQIQAVKSFFNRVIVFINQPGGVKPVYETV